MLEIRISVVGSKTTLASKVDEDSQLLQRFEEFEEETGYGNRSKALRAALRRGLDDYEAEKESQGGHREQLLNVAFNTAAGTLVVVLLWLMGVLPEVIGLPLGASLVTVSAIAVVLAYLDGRGAFRWSEDDSTVPRDLEVTD